METTIDFQVADTFARMYYLGENDPSVVNMTPAQKGYIAELIVKARERDNRWIVEHLNKGRNYHLIVVGEYYWVKDKMNSLGIRMPNNQVHIVSGMSRLDKVIGIERTHTKVLMMHYSTSRQDMVDAAVKLADYGYEVITDHPA